jgi:Na+-driven multidrug efflux pump
MLARSSFQAVGRAIPGLILTVIRVIGIALPMAYFLVYVLDLGIYGVWFGVITGNIIAGAIAVVWVKKALTTYITEPERGESTAVGLKQDLAVD